MRYGNIIILLLSTTPTSLFFFFLLFNMCGIIRMAYEWICNKTTSLIVFVRTFCDGEPEDETETIHININRIDTSINNNFPNRFSYYPSLTRPSYLRPNESIGLNTTPYNTSTTTSSTQSTGTIRPGLFGRVY